jgi:hypothetical protein
LTDDAPAAARQRRVSLDLALLAEKVSSFAADGPARAGLAATLLVNLVAYAYVWTAIATLPELMPLHYNGAGVVDLIGRPAELLRLPAIGTLVMVANAALGMSIHRAERPAAHILLWTALAAQIVIGTGAWVLVTKAAGE